LPANQGAHLPNSGASSAGEIKIGKRENWKKIKEGEEGSIV
jgi:hypothetical protein